jgi:cytochrome c553
MLAATALLALSLASMAADEKGAPAAAAPPKFKPEQIEFFEKQVQPILAARCFQCHGNQEKLEGDLFLKSRSGVVQGGESGLVVTPEAIDASPLLAAINYKDEKMPPKGKLPAAEIEILTRWVKEGLPWTPGAELPRPAKKVVQKKGITAEDRQYWAYQPVRPVKTPTVKNSAWVRNPIDAFVLAKLEAKGLSPAPPADRVALVRRVYYDLIGLPPTPEEVDAFVNDASADAYEKLLDRLLASNHYGEKWGRYWLDLVRYAETNGYERDTAKPYAWRYRDYVIDAFNRDLPYTQFIREQLAGDEIEPVTLEGEIATGYYRLGIWDDEPADRELERYTVLDGIVSTTSQVFLGTTVGCARCHDHKKDPIPTRDYYRLVAFFNDITDMQVSNLKYFQTDAQRKEAEALAAQKQKRAAETRATLRQIEAKFSAALAEAHGGDSALPLGSPGQTEHLFVSTSRQAGQTWQYFTKKPSGDWMQPDFSATDWKSGPGGFGNPNTPGAVVHTEWHGHDIYLRRKFTLEALPKNLSLDLHHDDDVEVYLNGVQVYQAAGYLTEYQRIALDQKALAALKTGENTLAVHCHQVGGGQFIDAGLSDGFATSQLADLIRQQGPARIGQELTAQYLRLSKEMQASQAAPPAETGLPIMCVDERGHRPTYVLIRGTPAAHGDEVQPNVPEVLTEQPFELPKSQEGAKNHNRLALANWIASDKNPMTARVMANRVWQFHFGRGIVPTSNDFGKLGELPTHPELLDWLAAQFVANGWHLKPLHKLLMMSNAYQMSSAGNAQALAVDGGNQLFWRFNMRRLTAEEARDSMLEVSGRLNLKAGGPSIFPPISREVLAGQSVPGSGWSVSSPEESNRRSVYIHVKRSLIVPILSQLDAADTDSSCPVRYTSTVPTQALNLLNSEFSQEQAAALAARLEQEIPHDAAAQIRRAIRLTCARQPNDKEVQQDLQFMHALQAKDGMNATLALKQYCLLLLNANEFYYLD